MHLPLTIMRLGVPLLCAVGLAKAEYLIEDTYDATNFFSEFNFFSGKDPTQGFVDYSSASTANKSSLAGYANNGVFLGVDHTTVNPAGGRASTRVESKKTYTRGLFISDIAHMPDSTCGVWPALWTVGQNWPANGEIDIIEGVNQDRNNSVTLHTAPGCSMESTGSMTSSKLTSSDCNTDSAGTGCGMKNGNQKGFGTGFNAIGGGVYAMEWTSTSIKVFFFARSAIPADIMAGTPDPKTWGTPATAFGGNKCTIDNSFKNHTIVVNTTFCGKWAGQVWGTDDTCSSLAETCDAYVAANPKAFETTFWQINSIKVYQPNMGAKKRDRAFAVPFSA
ncbi:hypothetical protein PZA11_003427 [Diplocarpon coronariae]|uniref:endo-1,3(4)-beta-glucanase n=1 Tax=Diplocarpon coronariae TaxID=2795749 RepID=A0A218YUY3_9HELO|nr:hypothetical protein B2J93_2899 [Marssonina coronariae]